ncbi:MAG: TrkH family potassium uptake protein [Candidatus Aenigmarchaeota archaeon]|nr:TrkH family potassium uptake protein [Candidatus Aenigmarchaeota archaeon]
MNWKSVFAYIGLVLVVLSVLMLFPIVVSIIFNEGVFVPFVFGSVISFVIGIFLSRKFKTEKLTLGSAMVIASLTFVIISTVGAIPYLDHMEPIDAVFESVSGFTTTGLTTVNPETLPYSILFWRSLTQWIGGIGILAIFLLLLSSPGMSSYYMYRAESGGRRIEASVYSTVKKIGIIYAVYTVIGVFLLFFAGMPLFDSVNHTLTSLSTGGFSTMNGSIGHYNNIAVEIVTILLMLVGSTSFFIHSKVFNKDFKEYFKNGEAYLFWFFILAFSIFLSVSFMALSEPIRLGVFYAFSALTTTGYTLGSHAFPQLSKFLIIILMVIGGAAGSTAGGLKLVRVGILGKAMVWVSKKISYPASAIIPFKFRGKVVNTEEMSIISLFSFIYIVILILSTIILSFLGYAPIDSFFVSASAEGTVGLTTIDIAAMNPIGKITLMVDMLLGRLEILPFFVLVFAFFSTIKKK